MNYIEFETLAEVITTGFSKRKCKMASKIDSVLSTFYNEKEKCSSIHRLLDKDGNLPSLPMKNCYINLTVVKHIETESDSVATTRQISKEREEYKELKDSFNRPRSSEEINLEDMDENHYQIEDLFENNIDVTRRVFMLGKAGIGKTTMCKKIVYEYYINGLWKEKFDRIIWLPLRIFKGPTIKKMEAPSLSDVFSYHYFSGDDGIARELVKENEKDESRILYLLDGLDEIQNVVGDRKTYIGQILDCLLSKPFAVVTSRPYTFHDNYSNFDIFLETIGFSQENILDYVRAVYQDPIDFQKQKEIIEFIEKSPTNIAGLVSIPILLDIICHTWTDIQNIERTTQITMTRLYTILDKYLWGQFLIRVRENDGNHELWRNTAKKKSEVYALINDTVDVYMLSKVAYKMLDQNKIEFTSSEAFEPEHFGPRERILLKNTNFLNCLNPVEEKIQEIDKNYTFIHLTIQEYLAAVYLVKCFKDDRKEFEKAIDHKYNPRYSIVWSFVAGILADSKEELSYEESHAFMDTFFNFLERDPIDELGIAHQYLIISCLNECSYPSLLNIERENRLINELLSYIFTQYVAGGKSLFKQPLPIKLLQKLISEPDEYWEADSERFKMKIFKEQFLPEEIINSMLSDIASSHSTVSSVTNFKVLKSQDYLGLTAIQEISKKLASSIASKNTSMIEKYINILSGKSFLPSDDDSLKIILNLIDYSATQNLLVKNNVLNICLNLKEIPFEVIDKLVMKFSNKKAGRNRNVSDVEWRNDILMRILKEKSIFTPSKLMQIVKQKCFSDIIDDFVKRGIFEGNVDIIFRLLLIASRRKLDDDSIYKMMELIETPVMPYDVKRLLLYVIGNMKNLPGNVPNRLFQILQTNIKTINLYPRSKTFKNLKYSEDMNFQYLDFLIPLMKMEFYDGYHKKRSTFKFKKRRHLSNNQFDVKFFNLLSKDISDDIKSCMQTENKRKDLRAELLQTWSFVNENEELTHEEWVSQFEVDAFKFLKNFSFCHSEIFIDSHLERNDGLRHGKWYKYFFSFLLYDEWDVTVKLYTEIVNKYRPLVVLAHKLYSDRSNQSLEHLRPRFEIACEKLILDSLIIRTLRDSDITENFLSNMKLEFLQQIQCNRTRLTMNIAKILEFRTVDNETISAIVDLIPNGDEYEVELTLSLLHGQTITEPVDIEKLKDFVLETNPAHDVMQRKCRYVANIFEKNVKLLKSVERYLLPMIRNEDFNVKLKALEVLHGFEIREEDILLELPEIIKNCREAMNWSRITALSVETLLNQKKLPSVVLEKMADYFDNVETQYSYVYLGFLNLLRMPITQKCIESLYAALDTRFVPDFREYAVRDATESENLMFKILKKQPLWNIIESRCSYKFKNHGLERFENDYTIKEKIIAEKILHDNLPMAVEKRNGKNVCYFPVGDNLLCEFESSNFRGLLEKMYERSESGLHLNLPAPLDRHHRYLKFHSHAENLKYISQLESPSIQNSRPDITYKEDKESCYIKVTKSHPEASTQNLVNNLTDFCKTAKYRHVDLRNNYLNDSDMFELESFFKCFNGNPLNRITTLILSNNIIGVSGLNSLLEQLKNYPIDFVFLDRNLIFFSETEYREYIDSNYQSSLPPTTQLNVQVLDLTLNFISNGQMIYGDPFANEEIKIERQNDMKESIRSVSKIHSQNLRDEIFENDIKYGQIKNYCNYGRSKEIQFITPQTGCIMISEKRPQDFLGRWLFNRGHAFIVIEWIPDAEYGQREIILADLYKTPTEQNRLTVRIEKIKPKELKKRLENCVSSRTIFESNDRIIGKLLPRLFLSRKQVDIFDYYVLSSKRDRDKRGRYNCITWTDEMLKVLDIKYDSMHKSRPRIYCLTLLFIIFILFSFLRVLNLLGQYYDCFSLF